MAIDLHDIHSLTPPFSPDEETPAGAGLTQFAVGGCCCPEGPCCGDVTINLADNATSDPLPGMDVGITVISGDATVMQPTDNGDGTYTARYCGNADGLGGPTITFRWTAADPDLFDLANCVFDPNGYLNNCDEASVSCGDDLTINAVLWPLSPDWIPAPIVGGEDVGCNGVDAVCPDNPPPVDGYTGRVWKRELWITLHNEPGSGGGFPEDACCEESIYGDFDGVPILLTWDGETDLCTEYGGSSPISPLLGPRYVSNVEGGYYGGQWATFACRFDGSSFLCEPCGLRYNAGQVEYFPRSGLVRITMSDPDECPPGCHSITPPFAVNFQFTTGGNLCHPTDIATACDVFAGHTPCSCGLHEGSVSE